MEDKFLRPKRASEVLDHTFGLSKRHFKDFFLILLIFMGPVYLVEAIVELASGTSFFRAVDSGGSWFEQFAASFAEKGTVDAAPNIMSDIGIIIVGFIGMLIVPIAEASILIAINHIRSNEEFTIGRVIKRAFSRFWPILGSNILFGLIAFGLFIVPVIIISVIAALASEYSLIAAVLSAILLGLGTLLGVGLLLTRWSFYFGAVVLDKDAPGLSRSWKLTKKRTWVLVGLYIVFYLIISVVSSTVQMSLGMALGNSVLLSIITNLVSLVTTLFFSVGYAVMFLDAKTRHDADDLKEMIAEYENTSNYVK